MAYKDDVPGKEKIQQSNVQVSQLFLRLGVCAFFGFAGGFLAYSAWYHGIPIVGEDAYGDSKSSFDLSKSVVFGFLGSVSALIAIFVIVAPDPDDYPRMIALSAAAGIFFLPVINSALQNIADPEDPKSDAHKSVHSTIKEAGEAASPSADAAQKDEAAKKFIETVELLNDWNQSSDPVLTDYSETYLRELFTDPAVRDLLRESSDSAELPVLDSLPIWSVEPGSNGAVPSWAVPYELDENLAIERVPSANSYFCQIFPSSCPDGTSSATP